LAPSPISILAQHPSGSSPFHDVHVRAGRGGLEAPHIVTQNIYPTFTYRFGDPTALVSGRSMDGKGHGGSLQKHGVLYFSAFPGGTASAFLSITQSTLETCFFITIGCNRDYSFAFCSRGGHEGALNLADLGFGLPLHHGIGFGDCLAGVAVSPCSICWMGFCAFRKPSGHLAPSSSTETLARPFDMHLA